MNRIASLEPLLTSGIRLDVSQHLVLCRHYVRDLRRSVLIETPELEKAGSKRTSMIMDQVTQYDDLAGQSSGLTAEERGRDQHLSAFLRQENGGAGGHNGTNHSPQSSLGSQQSGLRPSGDRPVGSERPPRASFMSSNFEHRFSDNSPAHTVARADLRASAEKILYTYLLQGSEREIILPQGIINDITAAIEEDGRDDPEVFDAAKDYVYQAMERDAFPGFLRSKALGNLVPPSAGVRLALGILALTGGLWAGFACIFLNRPKHIRCWVSNWRLTNGYFNTSANYSLAHSPVYDRHLLARLAAILYRPNPSSARL